MGKLLIIYFVAQIVLDLSIGSCFSLTSVSFRYVSVTLSPSLLSDTMFIFDFLDPILESTTSPKSCGSFYSRLHFVLSIGALGVLIAFEVYSFVIASGFSQQTVELADMCVFIHICACICISPSVCMLKALSSIHQSLFYSSSLSYL